MKSIRALGHVVGIQVNLLDLEFWHLMPNEQVFASEGYEQRDEYECFWDWMKMAVDELIEKGNEDCIQDKAK